MSAAVHKFLLLFVTMLLLVQAEAACAAPATMPIQADTAAMSDHQHGASPALDCAATCPLAHLLPAPQAHSGTLQSQPGAATFPSSPGCQSGLNLCPEPPPPKVSASTW